MPELYYLSPRNVTVRRLLALVLIFEEEYDEALSVGKKAVRVEAKITWQFYTSGEIV